MEERQLAKMGVLEFTNDTRIGELLGADFGLLGKYCAEELERRLMDLGTGKFELMDRRRLQRALKDQAFAIADLGSPEETRPTGQAGGWPAGFGPGYVAESGRTHGLAAVPVGADRTG